MPVHRIYRIIQKRRSRALSEQRGLVNRWGRTTFAVGSTILLALSLTLLVGAMLLARRIDQLPAVSQMETLLDPQTGILLQPSRFYDQHGTTLIHSLAPDDSERTFLALEGSNAFSPWLPLLTVAVEDPSFWNTTGFEGFFSDTEHGITRQLVDDLLLWQQPLATRMESGFLTAQIMLQYGHSQILEWYLNTAEYGRLAYGAEQAAQLYLGKSAADLNLAEAALLVASAQSPALNPLDAPAAALENKDQLLLWLYEEDLITRSDYEEARQTELALQTAPMEIDTEADVFLQAVISTLEQEIPRQRLERGGFVINTTLDADLQQQLTCAADVQLSRIDASKHSGQQSLENCPAARLLSPLPPALNLQADTLQVSALLIDPRTGRVLAWFDSASLAEKSVPSITPQPGSLLSPFVALNAFTRGSSPSALRWDVPGDESAQLSAYVQQDEVCAGPMRARMALANDDTLVMAEWMEELGEGEVFNLLQTVGWNGVVQATPSAALLFEGGETNLPEAALAYAVFANLGAQTGVSTGNATLSPQLVDSVALLTGQELTLHCTTTQTRSILSPALAYLVHHILSDEISRQPTLGYPSPLSIGRPNAGKIAYANDRTQSWTIGYTPERLAVAWFASSANDELSYHLSAGLWHAIMQYSTSTIPASSWAEPDGIITMAVCDPSGLLPDDDCPTQVNEIFIDGNQPTTFDDLYQKVSINRETGRLATIFTPLELIEEETYLIVPPSASAWADANNIPIPPSAYDAIQAKPVNPHINITSPGMFGYVSGVIPIIGTAAGSGFTAYRVQVGAGLNPQEWYQVAEGNQPKTDDLLGEWDTAKMDEGLYAVRLVVQRGTQEIETAVIQATVDHTAPTVVVLSPQPEETLQANQTFTFTAEPQDALGVAVVRWWVDGELVAEKSQSPYTVVLTLTKGHHTLVVEVLDLAGNSTQSEEISFTVQ